MTRTAWWSPIKRCAENQDDQNVWRDAFGSILFQSQRPPAQRAAWLLPARALKARGLAVPPSLRTTQWNRVLCTRLGNPNQNVRLPGSGSHKYWFFLQINKSHKVVVCVNKKFVPGALRNLLTSDRIPITATLKPLIFVLKLEMLIGSVFICQNEFDLPNRVSLNQKELMQRN